MTLRRVRNLASALLVAFALAAPAAAHPLAPSLFDVRERESGVLDIAWKMSLLQPAGTDLRPELPPHCAPVSAPAAETGPPATRGPHAKQNEASAADLILLHSLLVLEQIAFACSVSNHRKPCESVQMAATTKRQMP